MAEDWQPGDPAMCVYSGKWYRDGPEHDHGPPLPGSVNRVSAVTSLKYGGLGLSFDAYPARCKFESSAFRKIRPHEPDAEDAETISLLNGTPVREPVA